jgi:hypothetical protein
VKNNDSSACGSSNFSLSTSLCPTGFSCTLTSSSLSISPGSQNSTTIKVKSSSTASGGDYTFKVKATNSSATSYWSEGSAIYRVKTSSCSSCGQDVCALTDPRWARLVDINENIRWYVVGPQPGCTYTWTGDCSGTGDTCNKSFSSPGFYNAKVTTQTGAYWNAGTGVCYYATFNDSCSSAYDFGSLSISSRSISSYLDYRCGANNYYKVTIPNGWTCDINWTITVPYPFGIQTSGGNPYTLYTSKDSCPSSSNYSCSRTATLNGASQTCSITAATAGTYYAYVKRGTPYYVGTRPDAYYRIEVTVNNCTFWYPCDPSGDTCNSSNPCGAKISWGPGDDGTVCCPSGTSVVTGQCVPKNDDYVITSTQQGNCWYCKFGCTGLFCGPDGCGYVKCR